MQVDFNKKALEDMAKENPDFVGEVQKQEDVLREQLGFEEEPVPYDEKKMLKAVDHPAVKQVRVFKMQKVAEGKKRALAKCKRKAQKKSRKKGR